MKTVLKVAGILILGFICLVARLLLLAKIYGVIGPFVGGPKLTLWQIFAATYFIQAVMSKYDPLTDEYKSTTMESTLKLVVPVFSLLLSWGIAVLLFS